MAGAGRWGQEPAPTGAAGPGLRGGADVERDPERPDPRLYLHDALAYLVFSWAADLFGRPYRTLFLKAIALETPGRYAVQLYGNYVEGGSDPWREQNIIAQVRDVESAEEGLVLLSSLLSSGIPASA